MLQEKKHAKFSVKRTRKRHTYVCVSGGKKFSFFGKFGVLCFLVTPVLKFALLPYCRRFVFILNMFRGHSKNLPFQIMAFYSRFLFVARFHILEKSRFPIFHSQKLKNYSGREFQIKSIRSSKGISIYLNMTNSASEK